MIKCARGSTNLQKMQQKTATNNQWYGECLCLLHYKHLYSWVRITQTIPPKRQKISQNTTNWENIYLWSVMKKSSVSCTQRSTYSQILYYALERWTRTNNQTLHSEEWLTWFKSSPEYRALDRIDGEPMEFEWHILPGFTTLQLCNKVQEFVSNMSEKPEEFTGRIIFMSMFNDISWWSKENEWACEWSAQLVSMYAKRFSPGRWSFLGLGSEKKWCSTHEYKPQVEWEQNRWTNDDGILRKRTPSFPCFNQVHCHEERSKANVVENYRYTFATETFSHNYFCEPAQYVRSSLKFVWRIKERVERLSQQDRVMKNSSGAGFLRTVDVGQYFMTKDTEEFSQLTDSVVCREYTLPRNESLSDPTGWIRGNTKIGPVLEVTTSYLQGRSGNRYTFLNLDCKNTNLFVERLEKDKDTDKDVGADRDRTGRPVVSGQPTASSTQLEEVDIDFLCLDCHMPLWNKPKILVFVSSWRRSRVTLIDKRFKPICNKVMLTTHLLKNQRRWFVTWAM